MAKVWRVLGGEVKDLQAPQPKTVNECVALFRDQATVEWTGDYDNAQEAKDAWKARAQQTVDNALMRFFIIPVEVEDEEPQTPLEWAYFNAEKSA